MSFCLGIPNLEVGSLEIPKVEIPKTLEACNFLCKSSIEVTFEANFYSFLRAFKIYITCHLHARNSRRFLTFSGRESN
jgi:hypothetical protein